MTPETRGNPTPAELPLLKWLWRDYLKPQRTLIFAALFFMALEGSMLGALSYIVRPMFDQVFIAGDRNAVYWVAAAVGGIFVVRAIAAFSHRMLMHGAGLRVIAAMQKDMVSHLMTLDSSYFQSNPPGTLIERVRGDTGSANGIWQVVLGAAGRDVIGLLALLAVAISVDPIWTLIAVAGAPLLLGPVLVLQRYVRKTATRAREGAAKLSTRLDEIFHGMNTLKLNTAERLEEDRFGDVIRRYLRQEMKARMGQAGIPAMTDFVAAMGFAGVLIYGGNQIIDGEVKSSDVVLFMKGTPGFPQCGFSGQVVQILDYLGVEYKGINVLASDEMRQGIKEYSSWPTIPQLYVKGEFVGGCDIIREMFQAGELQDMLAEKGVATSPAA